jgi:hypothetical protein
VSSRRSAVPRFRFTLNVSLVDIAEDELEVFAGTVLEHMLDRQAQGDFAGASVTGRLDQRRLQLRVELESEGFNAAHNNGLALLEETLRAAGGVLVAGGPPKAVTEEYGADDFDTKVDELAGHEMRVQDAKTEALSA